MKRLLEFIKTTAIGGLLVIVPIAIILFVLAQLLFGLYQLAQGIVAYLSIDIDDAVIMFLIAAAILVSLCFLTGLIVQTRLGVAVKGWFSRNVARRIPMYNAIAGLTRQFVGVEGEEFAPVEVDLYGSDARAVGFLIEKLPQERCMVYVPTAPVATVGNIFVVPADKLTPINASMTDAVSVVTQFGVDAADLYQQNGEPGAA